MREGKRRCIQMNISLTYNKTLCHFKIFLFSQTISGVKLRKKNGHRKTGVRRKFSETNQVKLPFTSRKLSSHTARAFDKFFLINLSSRTLGHFQSRARDSIRRYVGRSVCRSIGRYHLILGRVFCCFEASRDSILPLPNRTRLRQPCIRPCFFEK